MDGSLTLTDLAETSGISERTIRFYIARGILDGPSKAGRGASYTQAHAARLEEIKRLQAKGRTLSEIAAALDIGRRQSALGEPTAWWQHAIGDDVTVMVRAGASPWRIRQIRAAMEEFARRLQVDGKENDEERQ